MESRIRASLRPLAADIVAIENESHRHSRGSETHFKVVIVSRAFEAMSRVDRARRVHELLAEELKVIHSLTTRLHTPAEWEALPPEQTNFASPNCQGAK